MFSSPSPSLDWLDRVRADPQTGATGKHGNVARRPGWGITGEHKPFPAFLGFYWAKTRWVFPVPSPLLRISQIKPEALWTIKIV